MKIAHRKLLMSSLLACFVIQTGLVYSDDTADQNSPLSSLALDGRELWHAHNCQTCHQIYGYGGFLGPDLTNAAARINRQRLDQILTEGNEQMPAFRFSSGQIDAIEAYLLALDQTGIGQARMHIPVPAADVHAEIEAFALEQGMPELAQAGHRTFIGICRSCHTPFRATPLGPYLAADLSTVRDRLSDAEIKEVLTKGRPRKGMIPTGLDSARQDEVLAYFAWLSKHSDALRSRIGDAKKIDLPWWEYR